MASGEMNTPQMYSALFICGVFISPLPIFFKIERSFLKTIWQYYEEHLNNSLLICCSKIYLKRIIQNYIRFITLIISV